MRGQPFSDADRQAAPEEASRGVAVKNPPGYADVHEETRTTTTRCGAQILREAERRELDVLHEELPLHASTEALPGKGFMATRPVVDSFVRDVSRHGTVEAVAGGRAIEVRIGDDVVHLAVSDESLDRSEHRTSARRGRLGKTPSSGSARWLQHGWA